MEKKHENNLDWEKNSDGILEVKNLTKSFGSNGSPVPNQRVAFCKLSVSFGLGSHVCALTPLGTQTVISAIPCSIVERMVE